MSIIEPVAAGGGQLRRALHVRHLVMLSVGGTIASGFLLFAGSAIGIAGPSVIISYAIAGIITVAVMACLAELAVVKPVSASFATYARDTMGPLAGFLTGWNYWLAWVMGAATESVAAGTYFHSFYSSAPIWLVAAIIIALEMVINLVGVLFMGEYEFILSMIKIVALVAFILIGVCAILGIGFHSHGVTQLTAHGGFFPHGSGAVLTALLTVFFAYVGIELVGVTAEESVNPARDVPRALFYTVGIVVGLFVVCIFILLAIMPWAQAGTSSSPLVDAIKSLNIPVLATIFNWIVISASVSSVDGAIYTASRMLFTQAREGNFSKRLATTHPHRKVPTPAIAVTASCAFVGALLAYFFPSTAYVFVRVEPDAVSLGKSMGAGMPISAVVGRRELLDVAPAINMYTMAGNPVACAAALASLDEIEERGLAAQAARTGAYLLGRLRELKDRHPLVGDVRGLGMMLGLETVRDRATKEPADREMAKIVYRAFELGLVVFYGGIYSNVMEITPPLIMTEAEVDEGIAILDQAIGEVEAGEIGDEVLGDYAGW